MLATGILSGLGPYGIRKMNAYELYPDPRSDSEMILSELIEYAATNNDTENIEQD